MKPQIRANLLLRFSVVFFSFLCLKTSMGLSASQSEHTANGNDVDVGDRVGYRILGAFAAACVSRLRFNLVLIL